MGGDSIGTNTGLFRGILGVLTITHLTFVETFPPQALHSKPVKTLQSSGHSSSGRAL